ncbi:MAG: hypothetical protein V3U79_03620 [Dehalococcoidia bacterium]
MVISLLASACVEEATPTLVPAIATPVLPRPIPTAEITTTPVPQATAAPVPLTATPAGVVRVTAMQLRNEHIANEFAAEAKYTKGLLLEVTGVIGWVGRDPLDFPTPTVTLVSEVFGVTVGVTKCRFPETAISQLARLTQGQQVTLRGRFEEFSVHAAVLEGCTIVR